MINLGSYKQHAGTYTVNWPTIICQMCSVNALKLLTGGF